MTEGRPDTGQGGRVTRQESSEGPEKGSRGVAPFKGPVLAPSHSGQKRREARTGAVS